MTKNQSVNYPYMPKGEHILYVAKEDKFILEAKKYALANSLDKIMPTGSVIVLNGKIIGYGANGSDFHEKNGCVRVKRNIPTGQNYELCEGCHPKNHSEPKAIESALRNYQKNKLKDAELYLWGHWWLCEPCWNAIKSAGIKKVYLQKDSEKYFDKNHPENIVGYQFNLA